MKRKCKWPLTIFLLFFLLGCNPNKGIQEAKEKANKEMKMILENIDGYVQKAEIAARRAERAYFRFMRELFQKAGLAGKEAVAGMASSGDKEKHMVKYPDDYRHWTHIKSMVIQPGHSLYGSFGGIHHIYANWRAFKAMKSGRPFPDGAVLVFDLLEARNEDDSLAEGPRKFIGVMQKDSQEFNDTGGWGFEKFRGDTKERVDSEPKTACFACHEAQRQKDYVFSVYRK